LTSRLVAGLLGANSVLSRIVDVGSSSGS
jgi:hypothetical protein